MSTRINYIKHMTLPKLHALIYKVIKDCIIRTNNCYLATVEKRYFKVKYAAPILNSKQPKNNLSILLVWRTILFYTRFMQRVADFRLTKVNQT